MILTPNEIIVIVITFAVLIGGMVLFWGIR